MTRLARTLIVTALVVAVLGLTLTAAAATAVYQAGSFAVSVDEKRSKGTSIHLRLPAALFHAALVFVPERAWRDMRIQAGHEARRMWPLVEVACSGLERSPDGTLIEVDSRSEHVRIAKRGNTLVIDVDSPEETVHISAPMGALSAVVRRMRPPAASV